MFNNLFHKNKDDNQYKKSNISFPIKTDHPKPYSRESRYVKNGEYWERNDTNNINRATVLCGGDLMCEPVMSQASYIEGEYDFRPSFKYLRPIFDSADLTMANLETIVSERYPYAREIHRVPHHTGTRYHCNAPVEYLDALRFAEFDALVMANNHNLDGGYEGIIDTLDNVDKKGFMHTGLFRDDRDQRILLIKVNQIKIGVLSYTEHINRNLDKELLTKEGCEYLVNRYSKGKLENDISEARKKGAEFILVYIHFLGKEYSHEVIDRQIRTAQEIADAGADCIMGSHMHCIQRYDVIKSKDGRKVPVTYSLGNLMTSDNTGMLTKRSFIYKMVIKKNNSKVTIDEESYIPLKVVEGTLKSNYTVFPTQRIYRNSDSKLLESEQELIVNEVGNKLKMDGGGQSVSNEKKDKPFNYEKNNEYCFIPEAVDNKPVRKIDANSFANGNMKELFLPDSLVQIDSSAFSGCKNLEKINIGDNLETIKDNAFADCSKLQELILPASLTVIGAKVFKKTGLSHIYIPESVKEIGKDAFIGCNDLTIHCNKGSYAEHYAVNNSIPVSHTMLKSQPISTSYKNMASQISIAEVCGLLGMPLPADQNTDLNALRKVCTTSWSLAEGAIVILREGSVSLQDAVNKKTGMIISQKKIDSEGICSAVLPEGVSPREAYLKICNHIRKRYPIPCIAVTGNAGKTTTKDLVGKVIATKYNNLYVNKNYNTWYTTGEIIQNLNSKHEMYVQEVHEPHSESCSYEVEPDAVVLTNLERAHLDESGSSLESSLQITLNILKHAKPGAVVFANNDCQYLHQEKFDGYKVIRYGAEKKDSSDYWAENIVNHGDGATFTVCSKNEEPFDMTINITGVHNVINAVGAYAVGRYYGVPKEAIRDAVASFRASGIRQNTINLNGRYILIDCYSITPLSAEVAAKAICELPLKENGKRILVTSYIPTLAGESENVHREIGKKISELPLDVIVGYRNDSKYLIDECQKAGKNAVFFQYHKDVIEYLKTCVSENDNIVFKGGTASHLEQVANAVFSLGIKPENSMESDRKKNGGDF